MRTLLALAGLIVAVAVGALLLGDESAARHSTRPMTLKTGGPVSAIAADGKRAALVVHIGCGPRVRRRDCFGSDELCATVRLWEPYAHRAAQLERTCPNDFVPGTNAVALAGRRAAWLQAWGGTTATETTLETATLARPKAVPVAYAATTGPYRKYGASVLAPVGDQHLLVFTLETRCEAEGEFGPPCPAGRKTGDIIAATIWRVPGRSRCPYYPVVRRCARVKKANGELTALAVDGGQIATRTEQGISLLNVTGTSLHDFPVANVRAAALSGNRLALRVPGAVEVYDTGSGQLIKRLEVASSLRLEDLDRGILVLAAARMVTLRRLSDGRAATIHTRGRAHAQLEQAGLFVAGGHRVTFTPRRDVGRMLDAHEERR